MRKFGLIGTTLKHSFSPEYFENKFNEENINAQYLAYELKDITEVKGIFDIGLEGINVTMPYKEKIIPYLDELSDEASSLGAVNTVHFSEGMAIGYNTDVFGFKTSLLSFLDKGNDKELKALVLGTGGASKAVAWVLNDINIPHLFVSRSKGDLTYAELSNDLLNNYSLIVNTTPLGMYPDTNNKPKIPFDFINENHYFFDLIYNPSQTQLLKEASIKGAKTMNGSDMLELQADASWRIWNGLLP